MKAVKQFVEGVRTCLDAILCEASKDGAVLR